MNARISPFVTFERRSRLARCRVLYLPLAVLISVLLLGSAVAPAKPSKTLHLTGVVKKLGSSGTAKGNKLTIGLLSGHKAVGKFSFPGCSLVGSIDCGGPIRLKGVGHGSVLFIWQCPIGPNQIPHCKSFATSSITRKSGQTLGTITLKTSFKAMDHLHHSFAVTVRKP